MELIVCLVVLAIVVWGIKRARYKSVSASRSTRGSSHASAGESVDVVALRRSAKGMVSLADDFGTPRHGKRTPGQAGGADARWVRHDETVHVAGHSLPGGMIYVGTTLPSPRSGDPDNCLIDKRCKVATSRADVGGQTMEYWPSYSSITPSARLAYLQWLAGGRKDPAYSIGYVFLFLYGLERRLVLEDNRGDAAAIAAELQRLLFIYGENRSFRGYASELLDIAFCLDSTATEMQAPAPGLCNGRPIPTSVRLRLGKRLAQKQPLTADDCLIWILSLPTTKARTPVTRCFEELRSMWGIRFEAKHPAGLSVKAPKTELQVHYSAASGTFSRTVNLQHDGSAIPEIAALSAPLNGLGELFESCVADLESYSRFLARQPHARGTPEAAMLLPRDVLDKMPDNPLATLSSRMEALFGGQPIASVSVASLLEATGVAVAGEKLNAGHGKQVGGMLDKLDIGFEPDIRYGTGGLTADGTAVLFKAKGGATVDGSKVEYRATRAMVEIAALAATSDGNVQAAEFEAIKLEVLSLTSLSATERARLLAFATMALKNIVRHETVLNRLSKLPMGERRRVALAAVSAVLSDGYAAAGEVRFLEKLHKAFGLPVDELYPMLHRGGVEIDQPTMVAAEEASKGTPIPSLPSPSAPKSSRKTVRIDDAKLARIKAETADVSKLLASIFVEEDAVPSTPPMPLVPLVGGSGFIGLEEAHGILLSAVMAAGSMPKPVFEARAKELRLLPGGAIETINEWAFDRLDEAALEDDDDVVVPAHLLEALNDTRANA